MVSVKRPRRKTHVTYYYIHEVFRPNLCRDFYDRQPERFNQFSIINESMTYESLGEASS